MIMPIPIVPPQVPIKPEEPPTWKPRIITTTKRKPVSAFKPIPRRAVEKGFTVQVKRRGKFGAPLPISVPKAEAFAIGARAVTTTAAATFKIVGAKGPLRPTGIRPTLKEIAVIRPGKKPGTFVQKSRFRIISEGEKREISYKGASARRKSKNIWGI